MQRLLIHVIALTALLVADVSAGMAADLSEQRLSRHASKMLGDGDTVRLFVAFRSSDDDRKAGVAPALVARSMVKSVTAGQLILLREFEQLEAMAVQADQAAVQQLLRDPRILRVDVDSGGGGGLDQAMPMANMTSVQAAGFDGAGRTVAVIDSGHAAGHPAFAGRVTAEHCFCSGGGGCCAGGVATRSGAGAARDDNGHGSNVSGIVLGSGQNAPRGAAPAAQLVSIKVLDRNNSFCCASDVIAALDQVLSHHPEVDVINLSLGTSQMFGGSCDILTSWSMAASQAVARLHERGTLVVAASLNAGNRSALPMPACLSQVLAVGAVWDADLGVRTFNHGAFSCTEQADAGALACFSNTSDMLDLVAPGAMSTAAGTGGGSSTYAGTSQASPLVAGCAALLRQAAPHASADQLIEALRASDVLVNELATGRQFPRLDCGKALQHVNALALPIDTAQVGTQFWLTGAGTPQGAVLQVDLQSSTGTVFGDDFRADDLTHARWGTLRIAFNGCDSGVLSWDSTGLDSAGFGRGGFALERLATNEASQRCGQIGFDNVTDHRWMAGTWFGGPALSGQGVFIDVLANGTVLVAFFTHRPESGEPE